MKTTATRDINLKRILVAEDKQAICEACLRTLTAVTEFCTLLFDSRAPYDVKQDIEILNNEARCVISMVGSLLNPVVREHPPAKKPEIVYGGS